MMDVTGRQFPALMKETILDKIGMSDSSYDSLCRGVASANADWDGSQRESDTRQMACISGDGGGRIVDDADRSGDICQLRIALSRQGKSNKVLSQKMVEEMLTPVKDEAGLGFLCPRIDLANLATTERTKDFKRCWLWTGRRGKAQR